MEGRDWISRFFLRHCFLPIQYRFRLGCLLFQCFQGALKFIICFCCVVFSFKSRMIGSGFLLRSAFASFFLSLDSALAFFETFSRSSLTSLLMLERPSSVSFFHLCLVIFYVFLVEDIDIRPPAMADSNGPSRGVDWLWRSRRFFQLLSEHCQLNSRKLKLMLRFGISSLEWDVRSSLARKPPLMTSHSALCVAALRNHDSMSSNVSEFSPGFVGERN